ncbi:outer membrane beta-barrel protein [Melioribacter sp. Ez-97]|uniref:outer membrane beta-barrel protein n=1 Tax=Melioribacter sp. Ez-97 TaxID=3423434 RepID=UPI003EDA57D8
MKRLLIICLVSVASLNAQISEISLTGNYTTSSKLFLHPESSNLDMKYVYEELNDIYSLSGEIRYYLSESIETALAFEMIRKTIIRDDFNLNGTAISIEEGYKLYPIDLSVYYRLPFSSDKFKFFMGGGIGVYIGKMIRNVVNVSTENDRFNIDFGIQASLGIDYYINDKIALRGHIRFRDPDIKLKSRYTGAFVNYEGKSYLLYPEAYTTKVNVDGITFGIGIVVNLVGIMPF